MFLCLYKGLRLFGYNCIEVFQKEDDGVWRVVHSTWSVIKPMEKDFSKLKAIV